MSLRTVSITSTGIAHENRKGGSTWNKTIHSIYQLS